MTSKRLRFWKTTTTLSRRRRNAALVNKNGEPIILENPEASKNAAAPSQGARA